MVNLISRPDLDMGEKVKIKIKKKLVNGEILKTEQLQLSIPKVIFDELNWEEGTLVEWETDLHLENGKDDKGQNTV